jgi:hypothetical protein
MDVDRKALVQAARAARRASAELARKDASSFCNFVLRDERTGNRIRQAPMHHRWHQLIDAYPRLVVWAHVDAGKTNQITIGRSLWELGRDPNKRIAIVSKTSDLAKKIVRACGQYIDRQDGDDPLHEVFPALRPNRDPALPWTSQALTVQRDIIAKDPSIQACGNYGNIHGARIDLLILDDILDFENTRTATPREHLWQWIRGTLFGRLTENARVIFIANAWHPDDAAHRLSREPRFSGFKFPVIDGKGELTWPEHWSHERIDASRDDMGPLEYARALLCQARDDDNARFKQEYVDRCVANGRGRRLTSSTPDLWRALWEEGELPDVAEEDVLAADARWRLGHPVGPPPGWSLYTGVDLAVQKHAAADMTVLFTIAISPTGQRRVCEVLAGRWNAPEILTKVSDVYRRWGSRFIVENVGAQHYIVDLVRDRTAIPVTPFTTGRQKAHPEFGVESLAAEFAGGKWVIPSGPDGTSRGKDVDAWIVQMVNYDPTAHTGDYLMAAWFAREGARAGERLTGGGGAAGAVGVRVLGDDED